MMLVNPRSPPAIRHRVPLSHHPPDLDIQIAYFESVFFYELAARFDALAHQH